MRRSCAPGGRIVVSDLTPAPEKACAFDAIELLRDPSHARALPIDELRALGRQLGLSEVSCLSHCADLPVEPVLKASFPAPGMLERVRELYVLDATSGFDALGMNAHLRDGAVWVKYPMSVIVWRT